MRRARAGSPSCAGAQRLGTVCNRSSGSTPDRTWPALTAASIEPMPRPVRARPPVTPRHLRRRQPRGERRPRSGQSAVESDGRPCQRRRRPFLRSVAREHLRLRSRTPPWPTEAIRPGCAGRRRAGAEPGGGAAAGRDLFSAFSCSSYRGENFTGRTQRPQRFETENLFVASVALL